VMDDSVEKMVSVIKSDPGVDNVVAFTGGQGSSNGGFIFMSLKPLNVRKASAMQFWAGCAPKCWLCPSPPPSCSLPRTSASAEGEQRPLPVHDSIGQPQDLAHWGPILLAEMKKLPGIPGCQLRPAERRT
jgi:multidrug efflux pump